MENFYGRNFSYLIGHSTSYSFKDIKLDKKFLAGFQALQKLIILHNKYLQIMDNDSFSKLIQLEEIFLFGFLHNMCYIICEFYEFSFN